MSEPEECPAAPDSTTKEQKLGFSHGEDVFLQLKDGKFYLGTVVEVCFDIFHFLLQEYKKNFLFLIFIILMPFFCFENNFLL